MSHDIDIVEEPTRNVSLSFTAGGQGCWIFVEEGCCEPQKHTFVRLDGDSGEAVRVARAILDFYQEVPA